MDLAHTKSGTLHLQLDGPNWRRERTHLTNPTSNHDPLPWGVRQGQPSSLILPFLGAAIALRRM